MPHGARHTRRHFLRRALAVALGLPLLGGLVAMLRRVRAQGRPSMISIPSDVGAGLSVVDAALVYRGTDGAIRAYSARCTHLGCRIDRIVGEEAVCPCHGSHFRANGTVASGPARRPLPPLQVEPDPASGGWLIRAS